jgi:hypothetical protein
MGSVYRAKKPRIKMEKPPCTGEPDGAHTGGMSGSSVKAADWASASGLSIRIIMMSIKSS